MVPLRRPVEIARTVCDSSPSIRKRCASSSISSSSNAPGTLGRGLWHLGGEVALTAAAVLEPRSPGGRAQRTPSSCSPMRTGTTHLPIEGAWMGPGPQPARRSRGGLRQRQRGARWAPARGARRRRGARPCARSSRSQDEPRRPRGEAVDAARGWDSRRRLRTLCSTRCSPPISSTGESRTC